MKAIEARSFEAIRQRETLAAQDVDLIGRVALGDRAAFASLYRNYHPRLWRFLERMTRSPHLVDEIINDTMLVVWRKAHTYDLKSKVSTWIFAIAWRKALKAMKRAHRMQAVSLPEDIADSALAGPDSLLQRQQLGAVLRRALTKLSANHRAVVELAYFNEFAYREIAQIMQCPVDTVKTRMFHARLKLKVLLSDREEEVP